MFAFPQHGLRSHIQILFSIQRRRAIARAEVAQDVQRFALLAIRSRLRHGWIDLSMREKGRHRQHQSQSHLLHIVAHRSIA